MSELIEKQQQYKDLRELLTSPGWKILHEQLTVRMMADQMKFVAPPSQVTAEERVYLGGKVAGVADAANLLELLLAGLESEIEHIRAQEEMNDARPDDSPDPDDADLAARSRAIDPGSS